MAYLKHILQGKNMLRLHPIYQTFSCLILNCIQLQYHVWLQQLLYFNIKQWMIYNHLQHYQIHQSAMSYS